MMFKVGVAALEADSETKQTEWREGKKWQQIHVARKKLGSANEMLFIREHH